MEFYKAAYELGYLTIGDLKEATKWGCLDKESFEKITGEAFEDTPKNI
ncbi:XkdX family protein [Clostridium baratii]|nr:XkdX family protein [Clostridium baratii]